MPRQPRYALTDIPQHVLQRGNNRQACFFADADYRYYLDCLASAAAIYDCAIHAYALMPNHVHLLMTPAKPDALARVMQSVGGRYVRYVNDTYGRTGTLFEGRYKACLIDADNYLLDCYRYIELNPVRANLVATPGDYCWSSYGYHVGERPSTLIRDAMQYLSLGPTRVERQSVYRTLCNTPLEPSIVDAMRATTNQCRVLGDTRFQDRIEQTLVRRVRPGKAGRPKKIIAV